MENTTDTLTRAVIDSIRRMAAHHGLWLAGAIDKFGIEKALEMEKEAGDKATAILVDRLCATLGSGKDDNGLPRALSELGADKLAKLLEAMAVNWLALDGVWFQAVESRAGMAAAKAVNDGCWASFSPLEAERIKALKDLPDEGGLQALAASFFHRMYGVINEQKVFFEPDGALVMQMTKCRVQNARQRKGLPDYPCKSAGVVEYSTFATTLDKRIECECIACPPDPHPSDYFCAWRFRIKEETGHSQEKDGARPA